MVVGQQSRHPWINYWVRTLADLAFPRWCLSCGAGDSWWCERCQATAEPLPLGWCERCSRRASPYTTLCGRCCHSLRLTSLVSAFRYTGSVEQLIQSIKFLPAEVGLDTLMSHAAVRARLVGAARTLLVPIPVAAAHEAKRGFNQAERLAQLIAGRSAATVFNGLQRTREARPQVGQTRTERRQNAQGLYAWPGPSLVACHVTLVDDVMTTGATLSAAASALRAAGAQRVHALTIATTPYHPQGPR